MILRRIGAATLGFIIAASIVQVEELVVHQMYPPPPGYNMRNIEAVKKYVASLPPAAMVIVLVGQLAGAFSGSWIAAKIGRSRVPAYVIGGLLLVLGIVSALVVP